MLPPHAAPAQHHFNTRRFFLSDCSAFTTSADMTRFGADLERFARRTEAAGRNDADAMIFEALVVFGKAGRDIDAERWTALALEVTAQVRRGDEEGAAARLIPHGAVLEHDAPEDWSRTARLALRDGDIAVEAQATARSRAAAMLATLFRALSHHFGDAPAEETEARETGPARAGNHMCDVGCDIDGSERA